MYKKFVLVLLLVTSLSQHARAQATPISATGGATVITLVGFGLSLVVPLLGLITIGNVDYDVEMLKNDSLRFIAMDEMSDNLKNVVEFIREERSPDLTDEDIVYIILDNLEERVQ